MKIGTRDISTSNPPLIIAELGINHNGCIETAKKMVEAAAKSGCECIKHQTHIVEDEMTKEARAIFPPNADTSIWDVISKSALSKKEEIELKAFTEDLGLLYLSTPFSRAAADFLFEIGIPAFKIGSGEMDNLLMVDHVSKFGKPVILSTGMHSIESIRRTVELLEKNGAEYALLECTSEYPASPSSIRLSSITQLRENFPNATIGFSDHSLGPTMSLAATALGARIIERHFTDSKYRVGPDIICSADPSELRYLIDKSKEIHTALCSERERSEVEAKVYQFARSSVVADRNLKMGHIITKNDIWARRPGNGEIAGYEFSKVIGKELALDVARNTQLEWDHFVA